MSKLACPKCKSTDLEKAGYSKNRKQRYRCRGQKCPTKKGWHGTQPLLVGDRKQAHEKPTVEKAEVERRVKELRQFRRETDSQRYVITAAQNATPVHQPFYDALMTYCEATGAELIVIPYRYKNPTSHWSIRARTDDWWDEQILPFCVNHRFNLNHKCEVFGDVKTQPTATSPLQSFETVSGPKWGVVGHAKVQLMCVPSTSEPKVMVTTGAITKPNYTPTKAGKKGEFHHVYGATVVETRGNKWATFRQIGCDRDGGFYDIDGYYTGEGVHDFEGLEALVMGDAHVDFIDPACVRATFGERGMVETLKPRHLVWHDVNDFYAGSHHHERPDHWFTRHQKVKAGRDNIKAELERCFAFVNENAPAGTVNVFPYSNHANEHLWKWLNRTNPQRDHTNFRFWLDTWMALDDAGRFGDSGAETIDPFEFWGRQMLANPDMAQFLGPSTPFELAGVDVGGHGHLGPNGAPGTIRNLARMGSKSVTGHEHTPGIFEGHTRVGTMSRLRLEYTKGPSSWMHCHGGLYPNGKRTLLFAIGDEWRI